MPHRLDLAQSKGFTKPPMRSDYKIQKKRKNSPTLSLSLSTSGERNKSENVTTVYPRCIDHLLNALMDRRKKGSFAKHLANEDRAATLSPSRFLYTLPFAQQRNLNDLGTVDSVEVASINTFRFGAQGKGSHRRHHWKTNLQL